MHGQTFTPRTYAELASVTADIPTGLTGGPPFPPPFPGAGRSG
jgi:hypothetical protein